jgi:hypothetical protein
MSHWISELLDKVSDYLATRKGLLPMLGIVLIVLNYFLQFLPIGWLGSSNLCLHLGLIIAIFGLMLAWAL